MVKKIILAVLVLATMTMQAKVEVEVSETVELSPDCQGLEQVSRHRAETHGQSAEIRLK